MSFREEQRARTKEQGSSWRLAMKRAKKRDAEQLKRWGERSSWAEGVARAKHLTRVEKRIKKAGRKWPDDPMRDTAKFLGLSNPGGKSLTIRNMASVTIRRLPGGAVAVTGRKMAGR